MAHNPLSRERCGRWVGSVAYKRRLFSLDAKLRRCNMPHRQCFEKEIRRAPKHVEFVGVGPSTDDPLTVLRESSADHFPTVSASSMDFQMSEIESQTDECPRFILYSGDRCVGPLK